MKRPRTILVSMWLTLAATAVAMGPGLAVLAVGTGDEGCTPGYWKNHPASWQEASTDQAIGTIFVGTYPQAGQTLISALDGGGGSGIDGARRILLRAAVAAWLNAAHDDLGYPLQRHAGEPGGDGFVDDVRTLLVSGDRESILAFASYLDGLNNLGCPLGNDNGTTGGGPASDL